MLKLAWALLLGGASTACALAALGLALYAPGPQAVQAAQWFAAFGFAAGLVCGGLHRVFRGPELVRQAPLPPEALAGLVRSMLASAAAERQARPGSAADRQPPAVPGTLGALSSLRAQVAAAPALRPAALPVATAARPTAPAAEARQLADSTVDA